MPPCAGVTVAEPGTPDALAAVKDLFADYAKSLDFDLAFQDFEAEMATFPGDYAGPSGAILLAALDGAPVGAVALRDLGGGYCEMKRLFVRPEGRGHGIGRRLIIQLVAEARARGYTAMRLDTVKGHQDAALALYETLGFRPIAPYCFNPIPGARFMELEL